MERSSESWFVKTMPVTLLPSLVNPTLPEAGTFSGAERNPGPDSQSIGAPAIEGKFRLKSSGKAKRKRRASVKKSGSEFIKTLSLMEYLNGPVHINGNLLGPRRKVGGGGFAAGPANPNLRRLFGFFSPTHHLHRIIERPVTRSGMDFPQRPFLSAVLQTKRRADSIGIRRRTFQTNSQSRLRSEIVKEFCRRAVLRDDEIHSAIAVVIGE